MLLDLTEELNAVLVDPAEDDDRAGSSLHDDLGLEKSDGPSLGQFVVLPLGCPRSRFWDLGKQELNVQNHPAKT